jgi:glycosyltransferase involved in cell wall biosynthesis
MPDSLSIIVPVYNEEKSIAEFHENLLRTMDASGIPYSVLYVNDGSTDASGAILGRLNTNVVTHDVNRGYGAAIKAGIRHSSGSMIAIIDCDGTYALNDIPMLYRENLKADMTVGARKGHRGLGTLSKRILRAFASYAVEYPIPDLNSGLRVFTREMALQLFQLLPNGFSLTSTLTLGALYMAYNVKFIPIQYNVRTGKSKIRPLKAFIGFTLLIFRTMVLFNPLKFFLPPAGFFGLIGLVFLVRDIIALDIAQTSVLMLVNAFVLLAIGLLAEAIRHRP